MKVRVTYTAEVDDEYRRAVRRYYGQSGMATRDELKRWFESFGTSKDDDMSLLYGPVLDAALDDAEEHADEDRDWNPSAEHHSPGSADGVTGTTWCVVCGRVWPCGPYQSGIADTSPRPSDSGD